MGNKALRKLVAAKYKEKGYGKLYTGGTKFQSFRSLTAKVLRDILFKLSLEPDMLVNDCDYFNHMILNTPVPTWSYRLRNNRLKTYWNSKQFAYTDGTYSCGCPGSPTRPMTAIQIRLIRKMYAKEFEEEFVDCDERGIKI